jgi:hypothetical protein
LHLKLPYYGKNSNSNKHNNNCNCNDINLQSNNIKNCKNKRNNSSKLITLRHSNKHNNNLSYNNCNNSSYNNSIKATVLTATTVITAVTKDTIKA